MLGDAGLPVELNEPVDLVESRYKRGKLQVLAGEHPQGFEFCDVHPRNPFSS